MRGIIVQLAVSWVHFFLIFIHIPAAGLPACLVLLTSPLFSLTYTVLCPGTKIDLNKVHLNYH